LWLRLNLEAGLQPEELRDVDKVKDFLEKKRLVLSSLKAELLLDAKKSVERIKKLALSEQKPDLEKIIQIKAELNMGKI